MSKQHSASNLHQNNKESTSIGQMIGINNNNKSHKPVHQRTTSAPTTPLSASSKQNDPNQQRGWFS